MENAQKGYKTLPFFVQAEIVYDFTAEFCSYYIPKTSRTTDQMIQAARSGKQNIAEGYSQKSIEGKLKLLAVSRGSLEELLNDYEDFIRQRHYLIWEKNSVESQQVRKIVYNRYKSYNDYKDYINNPERAANTMVCLINQTNYLLSQKITWLTEKFVKEGGFRENLYKMRSDYKKRL